MIENDDTAMPDADVNGKKDEQKELDVCHPCPPYSPY